MSIELAFIRAEVTKARAYAEVLEHEPKPCPRERGAFIIRSACKQIEKLCDEVERLRTHADASYASANRYKRKCDEARRMAWALDTGKALSETEMAALDEWRKEFGP